MNGNKKRIFFLSASDRINYGDLLFPLITKKIFENTNWDFKNYGLVQSDLSHFGALPTESFRSLQKELGIKSGDTLIMGGGEIFFPSWTLLYSYINATFSKLLRFKNFRRLENRFHLSKNYLSKRNIDFPFTPNANDFKTKNLKIIYNAVGGVFNFNLKSQCKNQLLNNLKSSTYISVRDIRSQESLSVEGVDSVLSPDSALVMSDFFSKIFLYQKSIRLKDCLNEPYIFCQLGEQYTPKDIERFGKELDFISKQLDCKVILCPIGLASGHNDDVILKKISRLSSKFVLVTPKNLFEIMVLIAFSKFYMGTSLHGAITAQSYGVPFFPLYKIKKLEAFYHTWHPEISLLNVDVNNLRNVLANYENWDNQKVIHRTITQKELIYKNYENIIKIINS